MESRLRVRVAHTRDGYAMTSIHDSRFSGASHTSNRRHNIKPLGFLLCLATYVLCRLSPASELVIGRGAVQAIVASALFNSQGRWYLISVRKDPLLEQ